MNCIKCNAELNGDARFCDACGAPQKPESPRCRKCDAEIKAGAKFCSMCGARQSKEWEAFHCIWSLAFSVMGVLTFCMSAWSGTYHFASSTSVALLCLLFAFGGILGAFAVCRKRYLGIAAIALAVVMPLVLSLLSYNAEKNEELNDKLRSELTELRKFKTQVEDSSW